MSKKHKGRAKKSSLKKTASAILEVVKLLAELILLVIEILNLLKQQAGSRRNPATFQDSLFF